MRFINMLIARDAVFLMYAEGLMEDNAYVADGRIVHTRVDKKEQVINEESKDQCSTDDPKPEIVK